jgi:hypothetical protein
LFLEIVSGVLLLALAASLVRVQADGAGRLWTRAVPAAISAVVLAQAALAGVYILKYEWSMRPTLLTQFGAYRAEAKNILRDHSLRDFLTPGERELFDGVEVWIESGIKTSGIAVMLKEEAAFINVRNEEYFVSRESRDRFERALARAAGRRMFTLCFAENCDAALDALKGRSFTVISSTPLKLPFYSRQHLIPLSLLEVARTAGGANAEQSGVAPKTGPAASK